MIIGALTSPLMGQTWKRSKIQKWCHNARTCIRKKLYSRIPLHPLRNIMGSNVEAAVSYEDALASHPRVCINLQSFFCHTVKTHIPTFVCFLLLPFVSCFHPESWETAFFFQPVSTPTFVCDLFYIWRYGKPKKIQSVSNILPNA